MHLVDCLDLGASLASAAPCLMADGAVLSYAEVQGLSRSVAASLAAYGVGPGHTVGVLSAADPLVASCLFGIGRAGAAWAVVDPTSCADGDLVHTLATCSVLLVRAEHVELVAALRPALPRLRRVVCLDRSRGGHDGTERRDALHGWGEFLVAGIGWEGLHPVAPAPVGAADLEPEEPPVYLAVSAPTEQTVLPWQPVLARGGRIVMRSATAAPAEEQRLEA